MRRDGKDESQEIPKVIVQFPVDFGVHVDFENLNIATEEFLAEPVVPEQNSLAQGNDWEMMSDADKGTTENLVIASTSKIQEPMVAAQQLSHRNRKFKQFPNVSRKLVWDETEKKVTATVKKEETITHYDME